MRRRAGIGPAFLKSASGLSDLVGKAACTDSMMPSQSKYHERSDSRNHTAHFPARRGNCRGRKAGDCAGWAQGSRHVLVDLKNDVLRGIQHLLLAAVGQTETEVSVLIHRSHGDHRHINRGKSPFVIGPAVPKQHGRRPHHCTGRGNSGRNRHT